MSEVLLSALNNGGVFQKMFRRVSPPAGCSKASVYSALSFFHPRPNGRPTLAQISSAPLWSYDFLPGSDSKYVYIVRNLAEFAHIQPLNLLDAEKGLKKLAADP